MNDKYLNKCPDYEEISAFVDGDLDEGTQGEIESHFGVCSECSELAEEAGQLTKGLASLGDEQPPDYLWTRIQARRQEEVSSTQANSIFNWLFGNWRVPAAVVAAGAICVAVVLFGIPQEKLDSKKADDLGGVRALASVMEAEQVYIKAISSLEGSLEQEKKNYSDDVQETITLSMKDMDAAIERCRQAVREDPNNIEAHKTALALYQRKVDLLTELVVEPM